MRESLFGCGANKVEVGHTNSKKEKVRKIKSKKNEIFKRRKEKRRYWIRNFWSDEKEEIRKENINCKFVKKRKSYRAIAVYFDQRLGAAHSKRWSKKSFLAFLLQKT